MISSPSLLFISFIMQFLAYEEYLLPCYLIVSTLEFIYPGSFLLEVSMSCVLLVGDFIKIVYDCVVACLWYILLSLDWGSVDQ
jgi:hypothetical protein